MVDTKKAGKGGLGLAIEGPSEAKMTCRDNRDGTCDVEYLPVKRGVYDIAVKFAEENIPGVNSEGLFLCLFASLLAFLTSILDSPSFVAFLSFVPYLLFLQPPIG